MFLRIRSGVEVGRDSFFAGLIGFLIVKHPLELLRGHQAALFISRGFRRTITESLPVWWQLGSRKTLPETLSF